MLEIVYIKTTRNYRQNKENNDDKNNNLNHEEKKLFKSRTYSMRTTPCNHTLFVMAL